MKVNAFHKAVDILNIQSAKRPPGRSDTLVEQTEVSNGAVLTLTSKFIGGICTSLRVKFHKDGYSTTDIKITRSAILVIEGDVADFRIHNVLNVVRLAIVGDRLCRLPNA